jgi:phosphoenolpyruvate carboxykinase (GTP)
VNAELNRWVEEVARLTQPQSIYWCNGSESEEAELIARMLENEELIRLNERTHPNC